MTAGCAVVCIIVARERMFMLFWLGTLILVVARALAMMVMPSMLRGLMTSMVLRPMRMSPRCKQTVG